MKAINVPSVEIDASLDSSKCASNAKKDCLQVSDSNQPMLSGDKIEQNVVSPRRFIAVDTDSVLESSKLLRKLSEAFGVKFLTCSEILIFDCFFWIKKFEYIIL
ncbi:unnamed protein product [Thelazia callipaeda]|uniref:Response regulatory domain-containing protein n=1 Tax=Thelazia callipaeda TaxID=103827 RepID=A0A0N5CU40_THECL|nr:unnamed protein product [Thelazia callipaeda]